MKKVKQPKLNVKIETVKPLTTENLDSVEGGASFQCPTAINCYKYTDRCNNTQTCDCDAGSDTCYCVKQ